VRYRVASGKLTVKARSSVHDVTTVWNKIAGDVDADPDAIEAARATFEVDMTAFDAGDWLKNRKLRKDFDLEQHPRATFELRSVSEVVRDGVHKEAFSAKAAGVLRWRDQELGLELVGSGTLGRERLAANATFELDIRKLGLSAPRFFVFKMEDVVTIAIEIQGGPA
jgi:polyisoprenoid-binding protein YceI